MTDTVKRYLSFGAGVNSTALMVWLRREGIEFEAVYADHGADWPETREYVAYLQMEGWPITTLKTRRAGLPLYDYYCKYRFIPVRFMRLCTSYFKVIPLYRYFQSPAIVYLGISAEESHRCFVDAHQGFTAEFPLVDANIDRERCKEIIREVGLHVPPKSGCFICPFQSFGQWRQLRRLHPELYEKAKALEDAAKKRLQEAGREPIYLADPYSVERASLGNSEDMFGCTLDAKCAWCEHD